jgi:hypothetical protein
LRKRAKGVAAGTFGGSVSYKVKNGKTRTITVDAFGNPVKMTASAELIASQRTFAAMSAAKLKRAQRATGADHTLNRSTKSHGLSRPTGR